MHYRISFKFYLYHFASVHAALNSNTEKKQLQWQLYSSGQKCCTASVTVFWNLRQQFVECCMKHYAHVAICHRSGDGVLVERPPCTQET